MTRTTIMLPEDVRKRAMAEARRRKTSFADFVRQAISEKLPRNHTQGNRLEQRRRDPLFRLLDRIPVVKTRTPKNVSANHDEYLYGSKPPLRPR